MYPVMTGDLFLKLGDFEGAKRQAQTVLRSIEAAGVKRIIADCMNTLLALRVFYPLLGAKVPEGIQVDSLAGVLAEKARGQINPSPLEGKSKVYIHDSRGACYLAEEMSTDEAYKPELDRNELVLGKGAVYEDVRKIVDELGGQRVFGVWSRALSKTAGTDDGLWLTYPDIAKKLAVSKLDYVANLGAEVIITEDLLSAVYLKNVRDEIDRSIPIVWLPELF